MAVARGSGAIFGIIGSLIYPKLRASIGLQRCGLIAYAVDLSCRSFAVISIFLPGSPFDPIGVFTTQVQQNNSTDTTMSNNLTESSGSKCSIATFIFGLVLGRCGMGDLD